MYGGGAKAHRKLDNPLSTRLQIDEIHYSSLLAHLIVLTPPYPTIPYAQASHSFCGLRWMTTSSTYLIEKFPTYFVGTGSAAAAFARKIRRHCFKFQAQVGAELPQLGFLPSSQRSWCVEINRPSPIRRQPRKPATRHALCLGRSRLFAIALPERIILILPPPSQICLQVGDPWMICIRQGKTRSALSVHTRAASLDMVVSVDGLRVCSAYSQSIVTIYSR
ncbi:hypothetical protein M0657_005357 [Pyricularia oryzae]|nr:hypothetical protein M0657_005357 [Pyricularia oryzae]KAI7925498.1 hypothetical protein M9X92_003272 [Pyricularia oryzae]